MKNPQTFKLKKKDNLFFSLVQNENNEKNKTNRLAVVIILYFLLNTYIAIVPEFQKDLYNKLSNQPTGSYKESFNKIIKVSKNKKEHDHAIF